MRRYLPWIALGLGAYLAFLISSFPAETALRWFAPQSVRTSNVSGTIWSGTAQLASVDDFAMRDLRWEIEPLPLLLARLGGAAQARMASGFADTRFSVSRNRVRLTDLQLSTTLASLAPVLPVSGASGAMSVQFGALDLERVLADINSQQVEILWPINANGTIRISDMLVEPYAGLGNQLIPLGSYELEFSESSPSATTARVRDLGGPLEFNGLLRLTPSREYALEGQVLVRPGASEALTQGLNFMAEDPGPDGRRALSLSGSL
ncbi:MAG: type II secretion system protein N [Gammaproteobacteria bacterium]|jgi:hypothetical protein